MFKKKVVVIIGAGASAEYGLPVGSGLMSAIAQAVRSSGGTENFRQHLRDYMPDRAVHLEKLGDELADLIPKFNTIDEVLHFLSDKRDIVDLGKIAISYHILRAEKNSYLFSALRNDPGGVSECDGKWANSFLRLAINATRRQDIAAVFENVTVIDFNYDRVLPQYLYSALQRLYGFNNAQAAAAVNGLNILHPYGHLGPLEWEGKPNPLPFASEPTDLENIARRIRTFTEEQDSEEIVKVQYAIDNGHVFIILGFGFHAQNIEIISAKVRNAHPPFPAFMTVLGVNGENLDVVADRMRAALRLQHGPKYSQTNAQGFLVQLHPAISLAVS
jgi:hypothetical protein